MLHARRAVLLALGVRLICAVPVGLLPERWAANTTAHFPRGELALLDDGAALLAELFYRRQIETGAGPVALAAAGVATLLGLVTSGALVVSLERRVSLGSALRRAASRAGTLLLATGVGALLATCVLAAATLALLALAARVGPLGHVAGGALALVPVMAIAVVVDAVRASAVIGAGGPWDAIVLGVRAARAGFAALIVRYLAAWVAQMGCAAAGLAAVVWLSLGGAAAAVLAVPVAVIALAAMSLARAWFLAQVVERIANVSLRGSEDMGYVSAPSETRPGSSVGRAED